MSETHPTAILRAAERYRKRGLHAIPLLPRSKQPALADWLDASLHEAPLDQLFPPDTERNVGLVLGEPSGGLVDIDLDASEAAVAAAVLLPVTGCISGRKSKPRSHYWYRAGSTERPSNVEALRDLDGTNLVEIRAGRAQTVAPPSVHPSGEIVTWHSFRDLAELDFAVLRRDVRRVAAAALLARHWPAVGARQDAFLALAGGLVRARWDAEEGTRFVRAVALATRDEEANKRVAAVSPTWDKHFCGRPTTGWTRLAELLGANASAILDRVYQWLDVAAGQVGGPWPELVPLRATPQPRPFPVEVLPEPLQRLVREASEALPCPPDYVGVPLLVLAGAALGTARALALKEQHEQYACLYAAVVGSPGSAKSPALELAARPTYELGRELKASWDAAMRQHDGEVERYEVERRLRAQLTSTTAAPEKPIRPVLPRTHVGDVTTEALAVILQENPRGLAMVRDELMAWITGMNQYKGGKGGDRQFYLAAWSGAPAVVDRKTQHERGPMVVNRPFLGVVGGMVPQALERLRGGGARQATDDDGFFDRILFAYPPEPIAEAETWKYVSREALDGWRACYRALHGLADAGGEPLVVRLTDDGRAAWERFTATHAAERNAADFPSWLAGPWSKLRGYGARLALVLHCLRLIHGTAATADVDGLSVDAAAELIAYFKEGARKVHALLNDGPLVSEAERLAGWMRRQRLTRFTRREAYRALGRGSAHDIDEVLGLLEAHGYIRPLRPPERGGVGRKPSQPYEAHPSLSEDEEEDAVILPFPPVAHAPGSPSVCERPGPHLVTDASELPGVCAAVSASARVALDLETTGLNPLQDRIRLLSLATSRGTFLIDAFAVDITPLWQPLAATRLVMHNGAFDLAFLMRRGFEPGAVSDTMLRAQLLSAGTEERNTLALCVERELGRKLDKTQQKADWSGTLTDEQLTYAATDVEVLLPLLDALTRRLESAGLKSVADIEEGCLPALVWMSNHGVAVDRAAWEALADAAETESAAVGAELSRAAGADVNWNSPAQVRKALASAGCELSDTTDETLAASSSPLAALLRRYRLAQKQASAFGRSWLRHVADDGRVYPKWWQMGAASGRMSCSEPNLQQLPRGRHRRCLTPPSGRALVKADYSQIELRLAAKISGDAALREAYERGDDLHVRTAQQVLGTSEVTPQQRQLAKALNFGLLYGMGGLSLQRYARTEYGVTLTTDEAKRYRDAFFTAYPGLAEWHRRTALARVRETRTLAGRRRLLPVGVSDTVRLNTPVQGSGADGLKRALGLLWRRRAEAPGAFPVMVVHDEIVVECAADAVEAVRTWLRTAMLDGMRELLSPLPVEVSIS